MISNRNFKIANGVVLILLIIAISYLYNKSGYKKSIDVITKDNYANQTHTIDSLQNVVDSLQIEIFSLEDGFDYKEHRYEDVVFQYELGLSYLKDYHPNAYKDFHRIIAHKERYSHEVERENAKILNQYK
jgi:hypothetical protein